MSQWDSGTGGQMQMRWAFPPLTPMVKRIIVANVIVFVAYFLLGPGGRSSLGLDRWLCLVPATWTEYLPLVPIWQVLTYGFLHDPEGLGHIFFNMLALYFFGGRVEETVGSRRFAVHYVVALVVGALAHLILGPLVGTQAPVLGASGAVLAMIVASAVLAPHSIVYLLIFPIKLWILALGIVVIDLFDLVKEMQGLGFGETALLVHLAGAAYGYVATKRRWLWWDPIATVERKQAVRQEERRVSDSQRMDELLSKISKDGLGSLSAKEREFLKRQSEKGR